MVVGFDCGMEHSSTLIHTIPAVFRISEDQGQSEFCPPESMQTIATDRFMAMAVDSYLHRAARGASATKLTRFHARSAVLTFRNFDCTAPRAARAQRN
jgi:hypothetical protein